MATKGAGNVLRRYVHGAVADPDDPIAWYEGSAFAGANERLLRADWRNSIVLATNGDGSSAVAMNSYDPFGIPGVDNAGRFQFTGQAWLLEVGLYYYKARVYSPTLGRFLQTDPIGYVEQINLYAYVGNDPINSIDPTGLQECPSGPGGESHSCPEEIIVRRKPEQIFFSITLRPGQHIDIWAANNWKHQGGKAAKE